MKYLFAVVLLVGCGTAPKPLALPQSSYDRLLGEHVALQQRFDAMEKTNEFFKAERARAYKNAPTSRGVVRWDD